MSSRRMAFAAILFATSLWATPVLVTRLTPSDGLAGKYFGHSVSVSGETSLVGAFGDDDAGANSGSAYIFGRHEGGADQWGEVVKLTASDGAPNDGFGISVSLRGDTAVVGAYGDDDAGLFTGSAYIFERNEGGVNNWGEVTKLAASDLAERDYFGYSVAISGDIVVVGAYGDDDPMSLSGSAYIFERNHGGPNQWGEVAKLTASDAAPSDLFGWSVAISEDTVLVGTRRTSSAAAYVFERNHGGPNQWGEVARLTATDGAAFDYFGYSVAIGGDTAVIGAPGKDDAGVFSGSAYVFERNYGGLNNWGQIAQLTSSDAADYDAFGWSVSIDQDTAVIGSYGDDDRGDGSGSAYIFERNEGGFNHWGQVVKLTDPNGARSEAFGGSVSTSGDAVVVGTLYRISGKALAFLVRDSDVPPPPVTTWHGESTPNVDLVNHGEQCDEIVVDTPAELTSEVFLTFSGEHSWRSILKARLVHNGQSVEVFGEREFPRSPDEGNRGIFSDEDRSVSGFTGPAAGPWRFCVTDTDENSDSGVLLSWSVHN